MREASDPHGYPFSASRHLFKKSSLDPAHGSSSSAETGILSYRVIIIKLSAAVASRMLSCKEIIQVTLMGGLIHAPFFQGGEIKSPADIVMAAEIVQEGVLLRKAVYNVHLFFRRRISRVAILFQVVAMVVTL